jgi:hypothetical protein
MVVFSPLHWEGASHAHKPHWSSLLPNGHLLYVGSSTVHEQYALFAVILLLEVIEPVSWLLTALIVVDIFNLINRQRPVR